MKNCELYIIILNYNNAPDTLLCVDSLKTIKDYQLNIILVDNNSKKECIDKIESALENDVVIIKNKINNGYAAGNNIGIQYALDKGAEYIVVLNNDVIVNENSLSPCIRLLEENEDIAIVGPAIVDYENGKLQSTGATIDFKKVSTPLINYGKEYVQSNEIIDCDYVGGACMAFKASLIRKIGLMPENYFLFWEEVEWCYRAKKKGFRVVCEMASYVRHKGSATINKISGLSSYYMERNRIVFVKRNEPNFFCFIWSVVYTFLKTIYKAVRYDKKYLAFIAYYCDGLIGKDRMDRGRL